MRQFETQRNRQSGFTLIEILLVVLIVGIITVVGANAINSQSPERVIMSAATKFEAELKYLCDLSVLENRAHGVEWTQTGHLLLKYQQGDWVPLEPVVEVTTAPFTPIILLNGLEQTLEIDAAQLPHVVCQTDGTFNPFEIRWATAQENDPETIYYSLRSETPWKLTGGWLEP